MKITGRGQVAWTNTDGMAGILVQMIHGQGREALESWLTSREKLAEKPTPPEPAPA
jgi:hypothetical protein